MATESESYFIVHRDTAGRHTLTLRHLVIQSCILILHVISGFPGEEKGEGDRQMHCAANKFRAVVRRVGRGGQGISVVRQIRCFHPGRLSEEGS